MHPFGLAISEGRIVSTNGYGSIPGQQTFYAVLLFTTNNQPTYIGYNNPSTNLAGIYTAVAGDFTLLANGVVYNGDPNPQPANGLGISQDSRYLFLMVIDGRQSPRRRLSDVQRGRHRGGGRGVDARLFGAWHAMNVDGGGSATMALEACPGHAVLVNRPINNGIQGNQRVVASHFGFRARMRPGFIDNVEATPGRHRRPPSLGPRRPNAMSQVEYGLSPDYGQMTLLDTDLITNHIVALQIACSR